MSVAKKTYWRLCSAAVILLSVLTFTPLVLPAGQATPFLFGIPRSLWMGIGITCTMVLLAYLGVRAYPEEE